MPHPAADSTGGSLAGPASDLTSKPRCRLVKPEPSACSVDDLTRDRTTGWDGVRNHQARNTMRNEVKKGDLILVHHSNSNPPGVVGIATSNQDGHPDPTAFDPKDAHFEPGSDPETPRWIQVEHRFKPKFPGPISNRAGPRRSPIRP